MKNISEMGSVAVMSTMFALGACQSDVRGTSTLEAQAGMNSGLPTQIAIATLALTPESFGPPTQAEVHEAGDVKVEFDEATLRASSIKFFHSFDQQRRASILSGNGVLIRLNGQLGFYTIGHVMTDMVQHETPGVEIPGINGGPVDAARFKTENIPNDAEFAAFYPMSAQGEQVVQEAVTAGDLRILELSDRLPEDGEIVGKVTFESDSIETHVVEYPQDEPARSHNILRIHGTSDGQNYCAGDSGYAILELETITKDGQTAYSPTGKIFGVISGTEKAKIYQDPKRNGTDCGDSTLFRPVQPKLTQ